MPSPRSWRAVAVGTALAFIAPACSSSESVDASIPVFVIAGQSNAEGAAPLSGLLGLAGTLPDGDEPLTAEQREAARAAFQAGIGAMCEDDDPTASVLADASIDALRAGGLDIDSVNSDFTIKGAEIVAHRYQIAPISEPLAVLTSDEDDARAWDSDRPAPLGPGFGFISDEATFFGPELGMGLELERHLEQFGVVKVTMSGSALFDQWRPGSELRQALIERPDDYLDARPDHEVAAFVWFQGFSDQFEEFSIRDYADNLNDLIGEVRTTHGDDTPVIVVESRRPDDLPTLSEVADAQRSVVDDLDNAALVSTSGLTGCFHYDSASQIVVGQRIAQAWLWLQDDSTS